MKENKKNNNQKYSYKPGRNDPCVCGSGKKYKHCCLEKTETVNLSNYKYDRYLEIRQSATIKIFDLGLEELKLEPPEAALYLLDFL